MDDPATHANTGCERHMMIAGTTGSRQSWNRERLEREGHLPGTQWIAGAKALLG
jgi:hypothetical protein